MAAPPIHAPATLRPGVPPVGRTGPSVASRPTLGPLHADDIEFITVNDADVRGAMLVVGLPTESGDEGVLVAHYLLMHLQMQLMGAFYSDTLPAVAVSEDGLVLGTLQVWRGEVACGPDGKCDQILVLKSEAPLDPATSPALAAAVSHWAAERGVELVIAFDAYSRARSRHQEIFVGSSIPAFAIAKGLDTKPVPHVLLYGFSAALLASANRERLPALAFFAPEGDPTEAASAASESLMRAASILPTLELDAEHVERTLADLHDALREMSKSALRSTSADTTRGYV